MVWLESSVVGAGVGASHLRILQAAPTIHSMDVSLRSRISYAPEAATCCMVLGGYSTLGIIIAFIRSFVSRK